MDEWEKYELHHRARLAIKPGMTVHCVVECMHVHASDKKLTESGVAKLFVKSNGDTIVQNRGILTERELRGIQAFIKENYTVCYTAF